MAELSALLATKSGQKLQVCSQSCTYALSPVVLPAPELDLLAEEGEEVLELGAALGVGEDLVVEDLPAARVDDADLEVDRALLPLEAEQVLLHRRMRHLPSAKE